MRINVAGNRLSRIQAEQLQSRLLKARNETCAVNKGKLIILHFSLWDNAGDRIYVEWEYSGW